MKYGVPTQKSIYTMGMAGVTPRIPTEYSTLKSEAEKKMSPQGFAYVAGGAGRESTMKANRRAFENYGLKAGMMKSRTDVDLSVQILGQTYPTPLLFAPIGALELVHPQADLAVARASKTLNVPMVFSNQASFTMEVCSGDMGNSARWFQLYWSKSDELVQSFVRRAEACGCTAIVVTLDTTTLGWRPRDLNLGYLPFLRGMGLAQYSSDPVFERLVLEKMKSPDEGTRPPVKWQTIRNLIGLCRRYPGGFWPNLRSGRALAAVKTFVDIYMRPELRWSDLDRLREMTHLPILVKGIQTYEDARKAFDSGSTGIVVSNHGGRQIDGGVGALHCLADITNGERFPGPVLFDSGIRSGADIIKAMALGADAVLIGRPWVYGLALDGQRGVESVILHLFSELELQMSLMGIAALKDLDRDMVEVGR